MGGGAWTCRSPMERKEKLDSIWFHIICAMVGDAFDDADDIAGIKISIRPKYDRLQLWIRYAEETPVVRRIGKKLLSMTGMQCSFRSFEDEMKKKPWSMKLNPAR